ncbi:hypothetical protein MTO96_019542 [Rhipicephalus appendiculatus]
MNRRGFSSSCLQSGLLRARGFLLNYAEVARHLGIPRARAFLSSSVACAVVGVLRSGRSLKVYSPFPPLSACADFVRWFFWSAPYYGLASPLPKTPKGDLHIHPNSEHRLAQDAAGDTPSVRCKCPSKLCSLTGDFRCLELREKITVSYPRWIDRSRWSVRNTTVDVTTACICGTSRSALAPDGGNVRPHSWIYN